MWGQEFNGRTSLAPGEPSDDCRDLSKLSNLRDSTPQSPNEKAPGVVGATEAARGTYGRRGFHLLGARRAFLK